MGIGSKQESSSRRRGRKGHKIKQVGTGVMGRNYLASVATVTRRHNRGYRKGTLRYSRKEVKRNSGKRCPAQLLLREVEKVGQIEKMHDSR